jgi:hypothetical protein
MSYQASRRGTREDPPTGREIRFRNARKTERDAPITLGKLLALAQAVRQPVLTHATGQAMGWLLSRGTRSGLRRGASRRVAVHRPRDLRPGWPVAGPAPGSRRAPVPRVSSSSADDSANLPAKASSAGETPGCISSVRVARLHHPSILRRSAITERRSLPP